jgi:hypothetical protein
VRGVIERDRECAMQHDFWDTEKLEVHHITNREHMPNYGYAISNGIALCPSCHLAAEAAIKNPNDKFKAESLYKRIGSSFEQAYKDSEDLYYPPIFHYKCTQTNLEDS